jgi:transposase
MTMMADRDNAARDVATQLGVSLSTLYAYVDAKGEPRSRPHRRRRQARLLSLL